MFSPSKEYLEGNCPLRLTVCFSEFHNIFNFSQ